jgi:hypothetical protein
MCIAHCSLFMPFIHFKHNSTVYSVSKQHKHHSTYPSMCHCSEPGHFATFSPHSSTTPLSHTTLHLTNCLVWIIGRAIAVVLIYFMYISYHKFTFCCLKEERESGSHLTPYYHAKGLICVYKREARDGAFGWGTAWCCLWIIFSWPSGRTMALRSNQTQTEMRVRFVCWG